MTRETGHQKPGPLGTYVVLGQKDSYIENLRDSDMMLGRVALCAAKERVNWVREGLSGETEP